MDEAPNISSRKWLAGRLHPFLARQRWFGGKARAVKSVDILDVIPMRDDRVSAGLVLASVKYADQYPEETYAVPLLTSGGAGPVASSMPDSAAQTSALANDPQLEDALLEAAFLHLLLTAIDRGLAFPGERGEVIARSTSAYRRPAGQPLNELRPSVLKVEQSNSSIIFGDQFILKLLRHVGEGVDPEVEIGSFLTERARFANVPALMGSIIYRGQTSSRTLGILEAFVPNQGNAWDFTLRALADYFRGIAQAEDGALAPLEGREARERFGPREKHSPAMDLLDPYLRAADVLGRRTAELHLALSSDHRDPSFAPEPFSDAYRIELQRSVAEQWERVSQLLEGQLGSLGQDIRERARELPQRGAVEQRLQALAKLALDGSLTRIHGDYHLGQVLCSDGDFLIIDFEGEPARPPAERRAKHSPLQDVAGMLRSFHYAADRGLREWLRGSQTSTIVRWPDWARFWKDRASSRFLGAYLDTVRNSALLPRAPTAAHALLEVYLLSKATYELGYELNNRPDWVSTPLEGILEILGR